MKKILHLLLISVFFFSCHKEDTQVDLVPGESILNLKINVNKVFTRAVEDGHNGNNDDRVSPKIFNVTVLAYNQAGTQLGVTDLTQAQIKDAIWGNYREADGTLGSQTTPPVGTMVGLPKGTTHVDVVVNRAPLSTYSTETNINYFNYRDNKNQENKEYVFGDDNFDRVFLTTSTYGQGGIALNGNEVAGTKLPTYKIVFMVRPYMARMEVYGAINVAGEEVWVDGHGNKWRTLSVTAYENLDAANVADASGYYPKGAVKGTVANGFDVNTVYIPEYYWYRSSGTADPQVRTPGNTFINEAAVDNAGMTNAGWISQPFYTNVQNQVKWYPDRYYAIDVESIFVNNIKVRGPERTPYMHPWPGSESATGWLNWYKAFHTGGWHTDGVSTGNVFLCMGNMWDRIATSDNVKTISFPTLGGNDKMDILMGKAKPLAGKSQHYATDRNLGVLANRAAAFVIYPQAKSTTTLETEDIKLRNEMPHIVLKVKVYENAADYASGKYVLGKEFITVSLFSDMAGGAGNYITNFQGGYIYRFNLNELLYSFVGDIPVPEGVPTGGDKPKDPVDPDPEMPASELILQIHILPWTIQNIYPSI